METLKPEFLDVFKDYFPMYTGVSLKSSRLCAKYSGSRIAREAGEKNKVEDI